MISTIEDGSMTLPATQQQDVDEQQEHDPADARVR